MKSNIVKIYCDNENVYGKTELVNSLRKMIKKLREEVDIKTKASALLEGYTVKITDYRRIRYLKNKNKNI